MYLTETKFKILEVFTHPIRRGYNNGLTILDLTKLCLNNSNPSEKQIKQVYRILQETIKKPTSAYFYPIISGSGAGGWRHYIAKDQDDVRDYAVRREQNINAQRRAAAVRCQEATKLLNPSEEHKKLELISNIKNTEKKEDHKEELS